MKKNNKYLRIFEYEKIYVGELENQISEDQFSALAKFNDKNKNQFYVVGNKIIKFTQFVGVIRVKGLTIEILPKAEKDDLEDKEKIKDKWHNALIQMIRVAKNIDLKSITHSDQKIKKDSLLDLFFEYFLKEVQNIIHEGMTKKYRCLQKNEKALKGKLLIHEQITKNYIHKERFFVEFQQYDTNNLFNQIINEALKILVKSTSNQSLISSGMNLSLFFQNISDTNISEKSFTKIIFNRKTENYKEAIKIAKLIILNFSPSISKGSEDVLAILFNMNTLFEKYIFKSLQKEKINHPFLVIKEKVPKDFWIKRQIEPDILIENLETKKTIIVDTKWKVLTKSNPPDINDLRQMYAYNRFYDCNISFLIYPKVYDLSPITAPFEDDERKSCGINYATLFEGDKLSKDIGKNILNLVGAFE